GRRDRSDDAPFDDLVGQLMGRPVGDGPARLLGGLAGDGQNQGDLLGGELAGGAGAWFVGEDGFDGASQRGAGLATLQVNEAVPGLGPASSPASHWALSQADLRGDLVIAKAGEGQENDGSPLPEV